MDFQAIKRVLKLHCKNYINSFLLEFAIAYLGSALVVFIVMTFVRPDTYINLSSVMLALTLGVDLLISAINAFSTEFNNTLKLGISRRNFLVSTAIFYLIVLTILTVVISLITRFEVMFNGFMYSGKATLEGGFEEMLLGNERLLFPIGVAIVIVGLALSAVLLKFGGKGLLAIYIITFGGTFIIAPGLEAFLYEKQNKITTNFLEPIGRFMSSTSSKIILAIILALLLLSISLYWLSRHEVRQ